MVTKLLLLFKDHSLDQKEENLRELEEEEKAVVIKIKNILSFN